MKLFISQPMKGRSDEQIKTERERIIAEAKRRFGDVEPIDSFFEGGFDKNPVVSLGESLKKLAEADIVWFAPGWERGNGCNVERDVVDRYMADKKIIEEERPGIIRFEDFKNVIVCISEDKELCDGTLVALMNYSGSILGGNAVFQACYYKVPADFDVKSYFSPFERRENKSGRDTNYSEFWEKAELVKRVRNFPHQYSFNFEEMAFQMFSSRPPSVFKNNDGVNKWKLLCSFS